MTYQIGNKYIKLIIGVILPLILGGSIYMLYRPYTLLGFKLIRHTSIFDLVEYYRSINKVTLSPWIVYSLPDALWGYALISFLLIIWNQTFSRNNSFWFLLAVSIAIIPEIGQFTETFPGTFDPMDLLLKVTFMILAVLQNTNFKSNSYEKCKT